MSTSFRLQALYAQRRDRFLREMRYRGASLTRKRTFLGPYLRPLRGSLGGPRGVGVFFMSEVPLNGYVRTARRPTWPSWGGGMVGMLGSIYVKISSPTGSARSKEGALS